MIKYGIVSNVVKCSQTNLALASDYKKNLKIKCQRLDLINNSDIMLAHGIPIFGKLLIVIDLSKCRYHYL